ncbi:30121_t:CDS:1 [Racocetra persica]|uniref:30121_t:CDS:1 n=1 Tax=Racocetra persica TaxID=160502 RepID=A0ACA9PVM7_9GLOM|nr:30121_t:CDS:1 [Racocetra persica]
MGDEKDDIQYRKKNNNVTFSYSCLSKTFQRGELGMSDSYLAGDLNFNYNNCPISSIELYFKGVERIELRERGRTKTDIYNDRTLTEKYLNIKFEKPVRMNSHSFIFPLPSNLSSSFNVYDKKNNVGGQIDYTLSATVHTTNRLARRDIVEIICPLKQILFNNHMTYIDVKDTYYDPQGLDPLFRYSFLIPEYLGVGEKIYIPIKIEFNTTTHNTIEIILIKISLKLETQMFFEKDNPLEDVKERCCFNKEKPTKIVDNELSQKLSLLIPHNLPTTHIGMFVNIRYKLCISLELTGTNNEFKREQSVIVANIKQPNDFSKYHSYQNQNYSEIDNNEIVNNFEESTKTNNEQGLNRSYSNSKASQNSSNKGNQS